MPNIETPPSFHSGGAQYECIFFIVTFLPRPQYLFIKVVLKSDILTAFFKALPIPLVFEFGTSNSKYILRSGGATS